MANNESWRAFSGATSEEQHRELSAAAGVASHAAGGAHEWTRKEARAASLKRVTGRGFKSRVREGKYEYFVPLSRLPATSRMGNHGTGRWVSRALVHYWRKKGLL